MWGPGGSVQEIVVTPPLSDNATGSFPSTGVLTLPPPQTPPVQVSPVVHAFPSLHAPWLAMIVAAVVPAGEMHPPTVALTLYVPAAAVEAPAIAGFCWLDGKPFGPVQEEVAPRMA